MTFSIGTPHTRGAGYLMNDDRESGGKLTEADIIGCKHCQKLMKAKDWQEEGGWCHRGQHPLCGPCADRAQIHGCQTWVQFLERVMERDYARSQYRRMTGV